jgi:hypothetical protein
MVVLGEDGGVVARAIFAGLALAGPALVVEVVRVLI